MMVQESDEAHQRTKVGTRKANKMKKTGKDTNTHLQNVLSSYVHDAAATALYKVFTR